MVSVLFCDLVGFTAQSESADPEDVDRVLHAYFDVARQAIEAFGGVVEKYIGDAVVGVFGVPSAHEDDPERAVRAGLRILEDAERLTTTGGEPLLLRVGINTGEALVRLDAASGSGEGYVVGDAINTASRIQSVAPERGVAVGLSTYLATSLVFDFRELDPATVKGKLEPVRVFHALESRARLGTDLTRTHDSPFVGRAGDIARLAGLFDVARDAREVRLVTIVGDPGLGKSRLVAELGRRVDELPELVTWRQGRCLPYGEGITFWALGEIVKSHAGILESDSAESATAKLDDVLPPGRERAWFRQRLLPLLGIEATSTAEREELFTAWRRFLELMARERPTVLVIEDLHWADPAMLDFVEHVAEHAEHVPLLIVSTTRPEMLQGRPTFCEAGAGGERIVLAPLSEAETSELVSGLLGSTLLSPELQRPILERSAGNPLYAEEFIRLLEDQGLLTESGGRRGLRAGAGLPMPDSVQAIIASRLDALAPDVKSLLCDAAVVGKVFWSGAVAAMGDRDPVGCSAMLDELERRSLVRRAQRTSMSGQVEYAFWHVLTRDVAYAQIPRRSRVARHVAAAEWIESRVTDRVEDHARVLAFHYETALDLARASGDHEEEQRLEPLALRFLYLAGARALGLDTEAALTMFARSRDLATPGDPMRADVLAGFGEACYQAGRLAEAEAAFEEAASEYQARGDVKGVARVTRGRMSVLAHLGDPRYWQVPHELVELLEPHGDSPELVLALASLAAVETFAGRHTEAIERATQSQAMADSLGDSASGAALSFRGWARAGLGDRGGLDDMRTALEREERSGNGHAVAIIHNNLGVVLWTFEGPVAGLEVFDDGIALATARGLSLATDVMIASSSFLLFDAGRLDHLAEVLTVAGPRMQARGATRDLAELRAAALRAHVLHGTAAAAREWWPSIVLMAHESGSAEHVALGLSTAAFAHAQTGDTAVASALLHEVADSVEARGTPYYPALLTEMVRTAWGLGDIELMERLVAGVEPRHPYAEHALVASGAVLAEARADPSAAHRYLDAAQRWGDFGVVPEGAFAQLGAGRCLLETGSVSEARALLTDARSSFSRLGGRPALATTDDLLDRAAQTHS